MNSHIGIQFEFLTHFSLQLYKSKLKGCPLKPSEKPLAGRSKFEPSCCQASALLKCPYAGHWIPTSTPLQLTLHSRSLWRRDTPKENFPMGINKVFFAWRLLVVSYGKIWWLHTVLPAGNYAGQHRLLKQTGNTRLSSSGTERGEKLLSCRGGHVYTQPPLTGWLTEAQHSRVKGR